MFKLNVIWQIPIERIYFKQDLIMVSRPLFSIICLFVCLFFRCFFTGCYWFAVKDHLINYYVVSEGTHIEDYNTRICFALEAQMGILAWLRIFPISFTSSNINLKHEFVLNVFVDFYNLKVRHDKNKQHYKLQNQPEI